MLKSVTFRDRVSIASENEGRTFRDRVSIASENEGTKAPVTSRERSVLATSRPLAVTQSRAQGNKGSRHGETGIKKGLLRTPQQEDRGPHPCGGDGSTLKVSRKPYTPYSHHVSSAVRPLSQIQDGEVSLNRPCTLGRVATPTCLEPHPHPAYTNPTLSCASSRLNHRPTPFRSKLRPPSSSVTRPRQAPPPPPHTPSCHQRRPDNTPLTLPAWRSGGVLRSSSSRSTLQHQQRKVQELGCMSGVRVNLQAELEDAGREGTDGRGHSDTLKDGTRGCGLTDMTRDGANGPGSVFQPTCRNSSSTVPVQSWQKGEWHKELASLPRYNYYELEAELVDLAAAKPATLVKPVGLIPRCSNPLATLLDQHFLISLESENQTNRIH